MIYIAYFMTHEYIHDSQVGTSASEAERNQAEPLSSNPATNSPISPPTQAPKPGAPRRLRLPPWAQGNRRLIGIHVIVVELLSLGRQWIQPGEAAKWLKDGGYHGYQEWLNLW